MDFYKGQQNNRVLSYIRYSLIYIQYLGIPIEFTWILTLLSLTTSLITFDLEFKVELSIVIFISVEIEYRWVLANKIFSCFSVVDTIMCFNAVNRILRRVKGILWVYYFRYSPFELCPAPDVCLFHIKLCTLKKNEDNKSLCFGRILLLWQRCITVKMRRKWLYPFLQITVMKRLNQRCTV